MLQFMDAAVGAAGMKRGNKMQNAINEFSAKIQAATGRAVRESELARFHDQVETAIAHRKARIVQIGLGDWSTISGRAELIEVAF